MPVSYVSGSLATFEQVTSGSYTVPAGNDRLVVILFCGEDNGADRTLSGVSMGDQTPTAIGRATGAAATYLICGAYYLTEAQIVAGGLASSAHTVSATWSTTPAGNFWVQVFTLEGVNQGAPVTGTHLNDTTTRWVYPGTSGSLTLGTNTADGLLLALALNSSFSGWSPLPSGWTTIFHNQIPVAGGYSAIAIMSRAATGSSQGASFTAVDPSSASLFGIAFAPAAAGAVIDPGVALALRSGALGPESGFGFGF